MSIVLTGCTCRRNQRDASRSTSACQSATITLPIHPFRGVPLEVIRHARGTQRAPGVEHLDLRLENGQVLRVPCAWTDLTSGVAATSSRAMLSMSGLLALADLLDECRKLDVEEPRGSIPVTELMNSGAGGDQTVQKRVVGAVRSRRTRIRAGGVCKRGASNAAGRGARSSRKRPT